NPMADVTGPGIAQRQSILDSETAAKILGDVTPNLRDYLEFLHETGCRPSEAARLAARDVNLELGVVIFNKSKTSDGTNRSGITYLTPRASEILRRLMAKWPQGPVFRNRNGNPWDRDVIANNFRRLRGRQGLGAESTAEAFRHTYATDALANGESPKVV